MSGARTEFSRVALKKKSSKKPERCRFVWWCLALVLGFVTIALLLAPMIVSTDWGKDQVVSLANAHVLQGKGVVGVEDLSISWFGPQKIGGVSFTDPDGNLVVRIPTVDSESSLPGLALDALR